MAQGARARAWQGRALAVGELLAPSIGESASKKKSVRVAVCFMQRSPCQQILGEGMEGKKGVPGAHGENRGPGLCSSLA